MGVIAGGLLIWAFITNFSVVSGFIGKLTGILAPFIIGFAIAYILNPAVMFFEHILSVYLEKKKQRKRLVRILGVVMTFLIALLIIALLVSIVLPQIIDSLKQLVMNMQDYFNQSVSYLESLVGSLNIDMSLVRNMLVSWEQVLSGALGMASNVLPNIIDFSKGLTTGIINSLVALIVSVYMLADKDRFKRQFKRGLFVFVPARTAEWVMGVLRKSHTTFSGFIMGKIIDSFIIGILCFVGMTIFKMPFAVLISVIVGVTNVIPFFGPFIGAVPGVLIILIINPIQALWFALFILALQQFDGNILGPKILGDTTGLPAFYVLFAIILGGGLFGFVGMLVGVPFFAVIYTLVGEFMEKRQKKLESQGIQLE